MSGSDDLFAYDAWPSRDPDDWGGHRGHHADDNTDFHVDLGCGRLPKGRIGVDRYPAEGVAVVADFDSPSCDRDPVTGAARTGVATYALPEHAGGDAVDHFPRAPRLEPRVLRLGLPFLDSSIESVISYHALEHVGDGFIPLMEDVYRVLKPGGIFRIVVPLFPSWSAASDPDHCRMFMADTLDGGHCTFDSFCGTPGPAGDPSCCWLESFSVPYTTARFERTHLDFTARTLNALEWWTSRDRRELRVTLKACK